MKKYKYLTYFPAGLFLISVITIIFFTGCKYDAGSSSTSDSSKAQMTQKRPIDDVMKDHTNELMAIKGVNGVYHGKLDDGRDCITVMVVKKTSETEKQIPKDLEGYPVNIEEVGEIRPMGK